MEVFFASKEENNRRREEEFLKLSPDERLLSFLRMISASRTSPLQDGFVHPNHKKGNFILSKKNAD